MITKEKFDFIKEKYGYCSSWAVWANSDGTPKSNMGDLSIFNNPKILEILNPDIVFLGLNFARDVKHEDWGCFHSDYSFATDYKTRYALKDTEYWGAYMTDIIKDYPEKESGNVKKYLRNHPEVEKANAIQFRQELKDIGSNNPLLICFGVDVFDICKKHLSEFKIVKISHYAHFINLDKYRNEVLNLVEELKK